MLIYFHKRLIRIGGAENLIIGECNELSKKGINYKLISYFISKEIELEFVDKNNILKFNYLLKRNILSEFKNLYYFYNFCKNNKNALLITASGYIEVYLIHLLTGIPYILVDHHPITMCDNNTIKKAPRINKIINLFYLDSKRYNNNNNFQYVNNLLLSFFYVFWEYVIFLIYKKARNILVLSNYAKVEKRLLFNVNADVVLGALSTDFINDTYTLCSKLKNQLPNNSKKIISISRLTSDKNINLLIHAFKISKLYESGYKLYIYGIGEDFNLLKKLTKIVGMDDYIFLMGFLEKEDFLTTLADGEIFVNLQYADYNLSNYEAAIFDLKILVSDINDVSMIETAGCLVAKTNISDLKIVAASLITLATTRHSRDLYSRIEFMSKNQTWECRVNNFLTLIK
jgi:glycosyltransferase involved in cell wall biosynthesis